MEHACVLCQSDVLFPEHFHPPVREAVTRVDQEARETTTTDRPDIKTLEESEIESIRRALEQTGGNRTRAAGLLGITRRGLIYKLKRLGMR